MVVSPQFIQEQFPVHKLVWENRVSDLEALLSSPDFNVEEHIEKLDPRGRTPLLLAVTLGYRNIALTLLKHNACVQFEHSSGWNVLHEATCRADPELLKIVLQHRDSQQRTNRTRMVPFYLRRLADTPDLYVEVKFELASWMPYVGSVVPGNMHRMYKMGSKLRVDSTVLEDPINWANGVTLIFDWLDDSVQVKEIYHSTQQVFTSVILHGHPGQDSNMEEKTYEKAIADRLSHPAMTQYVDLDKISFERNKTVWGWGIDKNERVNNQDCKVFSATNVQFFTKIRTEHLSEADKTQARSKQSKSQIAKILLAFGSEKCEGIPETATVTQASKATTSSSHGPINSSQYFDKDYDLHGRDIGRPKEMRTKMNTFKAHVWLSENYPVNLQEQIMPIIDIMALQSAMFSKLKQFIQMQIPAGFPVKTEIPFYHVISGKVSFHNVFAMDEEIAGVSHIREDNGRLSCVVEEDLFVTPQNYRACIAAHPGPVHSSDDDLFSWNLGDEFDDEPQGKEQGKMVDIYEALNAPRTVTKDVTPDSDTEEQMIQRAIEESLMLAKITHHPGWESTAGAGATENATTRQENRLSQEMHGAAGRSSSFEDLQAALDMSRKQVEEEERIRKEEEEALRKALELSLKEK